ncbi:MAG: hypothetical protein MJK04_19265 [Psychrosphaera sp.]|nr:hypothetical protein [Psychrosphaera sp.]
MDHSNITKQNNPTTQNIAALSGKNLATPIENTAATKQNTGEINRYFDLVDGVTASYVLGYN